MKRSLRIGAMSGPPAGRSRDGSRRISFDVHIGAPPPPHAYHVPPQPGPGYLWVEGYQYPQGSHYQWHDGYWTRPPYQGAYWVAPYHTNGRSLAGHGKAPTATSLMIIDGTTAMSGIIGAIRISRNATTIAGEP